MFKSVCIDTVMKSSVGNDFVFIEFYEIILIENLNMLLVYCQKVCLWDLAMYGQRVFYC